MKLVFHSCSFLTDHSKVVLLNLCSSLKYCLICVVQPCGHLVGKGQAIVAVPAGTASIGPLVLLSSVSFFLSIWLIFL